MECMCDYYFDNSEPVELFRKSTQIARKQHKCSSCKQKINKGDKYSRQSYLYDGEFVTEKACTDCISLAKAFFCNTTTTDMWYELQEYLVDNDGQFDTSGVELLTPRAREKFFNLVDSVYFKLDMCDKRFKNV
jgi:hypothetical protein